MSQYLDDLSGIIVITGPRGSGKTTYVKKHIPNSRFVDQSEAKSVFNEWLLDGPETFIFDEVEPPDYIFNRTVKVYRRGKSNIRFMNHFKWVILTTDGAKYNRDDITVLKIEDLL